ncbi:MAG: beta-galactosidase [Phycisphaerales bacterium]|nr:MAG: beta-galactosidase [Phycisphaerales bacterium]
MRTLTAAACSWLMVIPFGCDKPGQPDLEPQQQPATPTTQMSDPETFATAESLDGWSFSNGREWPGATGKLEWRAGAGRTGDGAAALSYNFEKGGHYVAAIVDLPQDREVKAVRLWVHKPAANLMIFRATDQDGESFQKNLRYHYPDWQQLEITLDAWLYSWGGDGTFRGPPTRFDILVENDGGHRVGTALLDDVQYVFEPPPASGAASTTYVESEFAPGDRWTYVGTDGGGLDHGVWTYRVPSDSPLSRLTYDRGILGRPAAMRLTVKSDGSGHEMIAQIGSHFQLFERPLGTLDRQGAMTFQVPMGDMKTWRHFGGEDDGIVRYPLRLAHIGVARKGTTDRGAIEPVRLEFVTEFERDTQTVSLVPHASVGDEGRLRFKIELRSLAEQPLTGNLHWSLHGIDRPLNRGRVPLTIPARGGPIESEITGSLAGATMVEGRFQFVADSIASPQVTTTIADAPPGDADRTLDPDSRMGVGLYLYRFHKHPEAKQWMERMCELAAGAGVKWTREEFHWNWIEPVKGEYDFRFFDQLVETAGASGISVYALCCYWTEWTGPPMTEEFIEPYCDYLRALVGRYGDRIKHWEIWNEPNVFFWPGPKALYPRLLERAYQTIKEADPEAQVLGCSTAGIDTGFVQMVLDAGAPFDALTVHPYRGSLDPHGFIKELRDVRDMVGGRDVWITEMGWPSHVGGLAEREQANHVARTYISALASGAARSVAWYDFREDGNDPFYNEHHFGLIRNDLTPKIGYRTLAAVGQLLGTAEYDGELSLGGDVIAFLFRNGQRRIAALWSPHCTQLVHFDVPGPATQVRNAIGEPAHCARDGSKVLVLL